MDVRTGENPKTTANCRTSLRAAIASPHHKRRNWVQICLVAFCLAGLGFNISATVSAFARHMASFAQGQSLSTLLAIFLFFWLATQAILWVTGIGVLNRLLKGRVLTLREGLDDLFLHRS